MCLGLVFGLLIVAGFCVFLLQSQKGDSKGDGLEAIIRERQKELIAQGKVDEALELESKLKRASTLPTESRGKDEASQVTPAIVAEKVEITDRERQSIATNGDTETDAHEKKSPNGSEKSINISLGGEEVEPPPRISLTGVPSVKQAQATNNLSSESQDYDSDLKIDELESAAARGDNRARAILSICYREGYGVKVDQRKAFSNARQSADSGSLLGNFALALCYKFSVGTDYSEEDVNEHAALAFEQIEKKTTSGDPWVNFAAGRILAGGLGIDDDHAGSVEFYELAVAKGLSPAKHHLAFCLSTGSGCEKDLERAEILYLESAEEGWVPAKVESAFRHLLRAESEQEKKKAFDLISEAALSGSPFALCVIGHNFLLEGKGTEKNVSLALQKLHEASDLGNGAASELLGKIYMNGWHEVKVDDLRATAYFERAAKQGVRLAKFLIGSQILFKNQIALENKLTPRDVKTQILKDISEEWSQLPSSFWSVEVIDTYPNWENLAIRLSEMFQQAGVAIPWDEPSAIKGLPALISDSDSTEFSPRGPNMFGFQIGSHIEESCNIFNRDHRKSVDGEVLRVEMMPVGKDYICSNESGITDMLQRDKARADDEAALEQFVRDQMGPLGALFGAGFAEQSGAPVVFGDEDGMIIKYVFSPSFIQRVFPNQYSGSNRQFLSFLQSKFDLPDMEPEIVETTSLFEGEGLSMRYFGFTADGVSVEVEADKTIVVRPAE